MIRSVPNVGQLFGSMSDDMSFTIMDVIYHGMETTEELRDKLNISKKECYHRIVRLVNVGLIERKQGKYNVTSFGKVIFGAQLKIAKAMQEIWTLKALDTIRISDISEINYEHIVNELIKDNEIKTVIMQLSLSRNTNG